MSPQDSLKTTSSVSNITQENLSSLSRLTLFFYFSDLLVRSHEVKPEGFEYQKGGKVLTVFSAPNYCDQMGNKGAYIRFQGADMSPQITSFEKVDHPKVPPMAYANSWGSFF